MQEQISDHFTIEEVNTTSSDISNECPESLAGNAIMLAEDVLEPARILVGPLTVNSWYRCPTLNASVGGEAKSAHLEARAADVVPRGNVMNAFKMIVASDIPYDKIILEKRNSYWIHIQIRGTGGVPRRLAYTAHLENGRMAYVPFSMAE